MADTGFLGAESGQEDESRRLASDLERYAGWLSKNYVSAAVRTGAAALGVALSSGSDTSLELLTLDKDVGRLPSGDVRTMLRKTLKKLHVALAIAEAT